MNAQPIGIRKLKTGFLVDDTQEAVGAFSTFDDLVGWLEVHFESKSNLIEQPRREMIEHYLRSRQTETEPENSESEVPPSGRSAAQVEDGKSVDDPTDLNPPGPDRHDEARVTAGETASIPPADDEDPDAPFTGVTHFQRKVLDHLFRCHDKDPVINIAWSALAERANVEKGSVRYFAGSLRDKGYITFRTEKGYDPIFSLTQKALDERKRLPK